MASSEAVVAATSVESGRFHAVEKPISDDCVLDLFDQFVGVGQGYLEVRSADHEFPPVTMGMQGGFAVIHGATTPDQITLLYGDGSLSPQETVEVPIMDELETFTGEFALGTAAAREALEDFIRSGDLARLGRWFDL